METIRWALWGNIYSDTYEHYSDGGPKCYDDMTISFRVTIAAFSTLFAILSIIKLWPTIKKSKELHTNLGAKPNSVEILVGLACWFTFAVQTSYKLYTGRGIFMNNPCHIVLLMQGFLLLTKKTSFSAVVFIFSLRWLYGVYLALKFPVTTGMVLPLEVPFFWIEHLLGAFAGPWALALNGRYLQHFELKTFLQHQLFGWCSHILYQRVYMLPLSLLTWANLNYTLCRSDSDPFLYIIGNWYYILAEYYLNAIGGVIVLFVFGQIAVIRKLTRKIEVNPKKQK